MIKSVAEIIFRNVNSPVCRPIPEIFRTGLITVYLSRTIVRAVIRRFFHLSIRAASANRLWLSLFKNEMFFIFKMSVL
jgi:hypothetical protein